MQVQGGQKSRPLVIMDGSSGGLGENKKFNSVSSIGAPINNFDSHQTSSHGGTVLLHGSTKYKAVVNEQV
jgi:hypothetical protein